MMGLSKWSVRLALDEGEAGPISRVIEAALRPEVHGMSIGRGPLDEPDEPDAITIEIDGASANDARVRCQHMLGELQTLAGLSKRLAPAVWVAPLSDDHPSSLRFLSEAEYLVGDERYEMAVVASQIHLEIQVRVLIEAAIEAGSEKALAVILRESGQHGHLTTVSLKPSSMPSLACGSRTTLAGALHGPREAPTGCRPRGQAIDEESARASLNAVSGLWLWLNARARPESLIASKAIH